MVKAYLLTKLFNLDLAKGLSSTWWKKEKGLKAGKYKIEKTEIRKK
jgi:hypothetical protein